MNRKKNNSLMIMLLTAWLLAGCQNGITNSSSDSSNPPKDAEEINSLKDISDSDITAWIDKEFMIKDEVDWNDIDVNTVDGVVSLSGEVDNILQEDRAVKIASMVKGVRSVINHIEVEKTNISDAQLHDNINTELLLDPATESYEVQADVDNGHVTLTGEVESWQEKQLVEKVVKQVNGVRSVDNKVYFNYKSDRLDSEIKAEIEKTLHWDVHVDDALVNVKVEDGKVTLTGTVASSSEKVQAETNAYVSGVESVDASNLEVKIWARDKELRKSKYTVKPDTEIKEAIQDAFLYDPRIYSFKPEVNVDDGHVTLTGTVSNLKAKNVAGMTAKNTVGVWSVDNLLKVRGTEMPTSNTIKQYIEDAIDRNPYLREDAISVFADNETVTLSGEVDNYFEKYEAADIASKVLGVKSVNNNLKAAATSTPYVFDYDHLYYYPYGDQYAYNYSPLKTDFEIKRDIKNQIWWSPYVNNSDVDIAVDDGMAILTGKVDSWTEYFNAEQNAYDGGALDVDNNLVVQRN